MGMSTSVMGVRDLDGNFSKMMKVKLTCEEANVDYPQEVKLYFGQYVAESESLLRREMEEMEIQPAIEKLNEEMTDGLQVNLDRLPKDTKAIRFRNSY